MGKSKSSYASIEYRFIAKVVDLFGALCFQVGGAMLGFITVLSLNPEAPVDSPIFLNLLTQGFYFGILFWSFVYFIINVGVLQGYYGSTVGKWLFKIEVQDLNGNHLGFFKSVMRSVFSVFSFVPFMLGYLAIFWSQKRQCWHDLMIESKVVYIKSPIHLKLLEQYPVIALQGPVEEKESA
ncbi:MAG: hypothetical protein CL678_11275 [Bdellovibrionaceae bacterium]|nr:hypothetical protein [Pseudobdellovibrionaceae bacterium]|tara:strand:+ start:238 stop:780 length:543 start_codon:yes stop_codon:yes gene_type:complete